MQSSSVFDKNWKSLIKPSKLYPYDPEIQTPKLVTVKKITAPIKAPVIRFKIFSKKNFDIKPIIKTLPHVKNVKLWYPIIRSVKTKLIITTGMYFLPNIAGT